MNYTYLEERNHQAVDVVIVSGTEAEMDEMWSFVHDKSQQYWLRWAGAFRRNSLDHCTGEPLAFCCLLFRNTRTQKLGCAIGFLLEKTTPRRLNENICR